MPSAFQHYRHRSCPGRFIRVAALAWVLLFLHASQALAQGWPFGGVMPNVGAMSYDLTLTQAYDFQGVRMTGYASSQGGYVRWVHCMQTPLVQYQTCQLMVNGIVSNEFALPPMVNLRKWLTMLLGPGLPRGFTFDMGPQGGMETSGQWQWGAWQARGRFRYWR